ncbi:MAG: hypothetical protein ACYTED_10830 [Planctomycetota bacterium]|jgi:hypothetical protein
MRGCVTGLVLLGGCTSPEHRAPRPNEVSARYVEMPARAQPGMFISWRYLTNQRDLYAVFEETLACVAKTSAYTTIEWRRKLRNRERGVIAARFGPDGTLLGVWRGPPGEVGRPMKVVDKGRKLGRVEKEVRWRAKQLGLTLRNVELVPGKETGSVKTAAGSFRCRIHRVNVTLPLSESKATFWYAKERLPLQQLVKVHWELPRGGFSIMELVAFGDEGAERTLRIPK